MTNLQPYFHSAGLNLEWKRETSPLRRQPWGYEVRRRCSRSESSVILCVTHACTLVEVNTRTLAIPYSAIWFCMLCDAVNRLGCSLDWMEMRLEGEMCVCMSGQCFASADGRGLKCCQWSERAQWGPVRSTTEFWCKHTGDWATLPSILNANIDIRSAVLSL